MKIAIALESRLCALAGPQGRRASPLRAFAPPWAFVFQSVKSAQSVDKTSAESVTLRTRMKIAIGADHAGYQLKDSLKRLLDEMGVPYEDFGTNTGQSVDYPDFARMVAEGVAGGLFDRGILVCGTGVGMAIAANKVDGVRSAAIVDTDTAKLSREHNDLNVLTLGARMLPESRAREIVKTFLQTPFEGGRHSNRVQKIHAIEN
ncbi:MAG TPA: ribose 5-phosphate isomerase B [Vicinamibacterales bacterium]|nr:ribose 5-phosphate isomerase B [Vicinamibacterales bacterium]